ncbi:FtsX-like permease family protein [Salipiger mangrovisoli]|uniref:FtsX-like permease family protein n=1 Tax=Salipiger mangrovisoli TaxID=2865933 RepID=A0ABR9X440_9RHOB|nr:FtsX-like permease family protein [Salipiger mangrovisoli]MBE9638303.1 FtsX-like permease family protein [Salipiger mangrovisoli]
MRVIWDSLPGAAQDLALLIALLVPALITGLLVLRGYAPWPLLRGFLGRFRWSALLFVLLIAISTGMGIGLLAQERGLRRGTAQAADKFDLIVAAPGSELTALFASVFLQPSDMGLVSGNAFAEIAGHSEVEIAAPLAFGDSHGAAPVVGTTAEFLRHLSGNRVEGRLWHDHAEAVIGALVPLEIGEGFTPAHGIGDAAEPEAHGGAPDGDEVDHGQTDAHAHSHDHGGALTVVGRMAPTGSPWDRAILIPVEFVWEIHGLANGHAPEREAQIGPPFDAEYFPGTPAVVVRARALWANYALRSEFTRDGETMAFFPGAVLSGLYRVMGDVRQAMSLMALVTQGLVAASVLTGLFILTRLFRRQIALLRALGAPRRFVFATVWVFCAALLLCGALLGLLVGWGAAELLSRVVSARTDIAISALPGWTELHLLAGFVSLSMLLSLLPAAVVLRQPVVDGLRS